MNNFFPCCVIAVGEKGKKRLLTNTKVHFNSRRHWKVSLTGKLIDNRCRTGNYLNYAKCPNITGRKRLKEPVSGILVLIKKIECYCPIHFQFSKLWQNCKTLTCDQFA